MATVHPRQATPADVSSFDRRAQAWSALSRLSVSTTTATTTTITSPIVAKAREVELPFRMRYFVRCLVSCETRGVQGGEEEIDAR